MVRKVVIYTCDQCGKEAQYPITGLRRLRDHLMDIGWIFIRNEKHVDLCSNECYKDHANGE